jgi:hypothetical protein
MYGYALFSIQIPHPSRNGLVVIVMKFKVKYVRIYCGCHIAIYALKIILSE